MKINVSEERRKLAKNQIKLLERLYHAVSDDGFDTDVDLSDFNSNHLKDFWVYTSGFLCLNNYEKYDFSTSELQDIFAGEFALSVLSKDKKKELLEKYNITVPSSGYSHVIKLETIQDGQFLIKTGQHIGSARMQDVLVLSTEDPSFESKYDGYYSDNEKLAMVRNVFAHNTPYIAGNHLLFRRPNDNLIVSKMWLRGFAETFANKYALFDYDKAKEYLKSNLANQANYILNNQDVDKALSSLKDFFDSVSRENFYRINNLIKARIQYIPDFFNLSFDQKADIITSLCANNQVYFEISKGTSNPAIIYTLQKLISKELEKREESAILTEKEIEDYKNKMLEIDKKLKALSVDFDVVQEKINKNARSPQILKILKLQADNLIKEFYKNKHEFDVESKRFFNMIKLESLNMDTMNIDQLSGSSFEVAFNIVCLMGFNQLVTSAFYDDLLAATCFNELNREQTNFFSAFDLSKFKLNNKPIADTGATKAYVLLCLREAMCHQDVENGFGVYYYVPGLKQGEVKNYKDIKITFRAERQNAEITGSLDDFYKLFSSDGFTKERKEKIITGDIEILDVGNNEEQDNNQNSEEIINKNDEELE